MQAIVTRFVAPRDHDMNSYVIAKCDAGRVRVLWNDKLPPSGNHAAACVALCTKLGWDGAWFMGGLPERLPRWAYVFVCTERKGALRVVRDHA